MTIQVGLEVRQTVKKGRGVFSLRDFHCGELIESSEIIIVPARQRAQLDNTELYNYYFNWGPDKQDAAIALGYGSLYNHSYSPNAMYYKNFEASRVDFVATREIAVGEEITVNYNGDPSELKPIWFSVAEEP